MPQPVRLGHYLSSDLYNDNKTGLIRAGPSSELVALPFCPIANGNVVHMRWKIANFTDMSRQVLYACVQLSWGNHPGADLAKSN